MVFIAALTSGAWAQNVTTLAGNGAITPFANGGGSSATFTVPWYLVYDAAGNLYVADDTNYLVRKITPAGVVSTYAGMQGVAGDHDDANPLAAKFGKPFALAIDQPGNLYVFDAAYCKIHRIDNLTHAVTLFAGASCGYANATNALLARMSSQVTAMAVDAFGNLLLADGGNCSVRKIAAGGTHAVTTVAGAPPPTAQCGYVNGLGTGARFRALTGLAIGPAGDLFVGDTGNNVIRKIDPTTAQVSLVAGIPGSVGSTDGAFLTSRFPGGYLRMVFDGSGHLYVADQVDQRLRKLDFATQTVSTFAGSSSGFVDNVPPLTAKFQFPWGIAYHANPGGDLLAVADTYNRRIRVMKLVGLIKLCKVAGVGPPPLPVGMVFTFNVILPGQAAQSYTVAAGPGPNGTCITLPPYPLDTVVRINEVIPRDIKVTSIGVAPATQTVVTDVLRGAVAVRVASTTTTVTYTDDY